MNFNDTPKPSLDDVFDAIRTDEPSAGEIHAAAERVSAKLGLGPAVAGTPLHIENCAGFQALIPAYLAGSLPSETALLIEDHSRDRVLAFNRKFRASVTACSRRTDITDLPSPFEPRSQIPFGNTQSVSQAG